MLISQESERQMADPDKWNFQSAAAFGNFMQDPSSVVRVEWRKVRRDQHHGWTSHSWLEAILGDGRRLRLERFQDVGLTESIVAADQRSDDSIIWEGLAASWTELARPLTVDRLRELAVAASAEPYSVTESNCHHFVRDIWNGVVIERLQRSHYPDRVKTSMLWGASESIGRLLFSAVGPLGSFASVAAPLAPPPTSAAAAPSALLRLGSIGGSRPSAPLRPTGDHGEPFFPAPSGNAVGSRASAAHARLSARQEDVDRISGEIFSPMRSGITYSALDRHFAQAVRQGRVHVLESRGELVRTSWSQGPATCEAWAATWAPGAAAAALRLARLLAATDVVALLQRILPHVAEAPPEPPEEVGLPRLGSLSSQCGDGSHRERGDDADLAFVLLLGSEVRLVTYAVLQPPARKPGRPRRLRLLSGSVQEGKECSFVYTLRGVPAGEGQPSAVDCLSEELEALRCALMTGDWSFLTLL